jgi:hypothetical protein
VGNQPSSRPRFDAVLGGRGSRSRKENIVSKGTISRIFIGSVIAVVAGGILAIAAATVAFANGVFIMEGPDVVGVRGTTLAWTMVGIGIVATLVVIGGLVGGLVAWIGALLNTAQLDDKAWFLVLLLLGIWNLGVIAMIAYVIAGPDGRRPPVVIADAQMA